MLSGVLNANYVCDIHDFVGYQISDSPALVNSKLLKIWHQVLVYLLV